MQTNGIVRVKVNQARIVEELYLVQSENGKARHVSLDREKALLNADAHQNVTRILTIALEGDSFETHYKTIPGRYHFNKKALRLINKKTLELAKQTGKQTLLVVV
ncbi:hypothetical protein [Brevibacillus migulae]|uniref:hypothetical protein n=1 Tax=Brevibacillus migulae TaxID=1644114 RepID=UPI00106E113F|nr:hypothetical protein [Brevibacillus migulae]